MAADPDSLDLNLAAATHQDMLSMVEEERDLRKGLLDRVSYSLKILAFLISLLVYRKISRLPATLFVVVDTSREQLK